MTTSGFEILDNFMFKRQMVEVLWESERLGGQRRYNTQVLDTQRVQSAPETPSAWNCGGHHAWLLSTTHSEHRKVCSSRTKWNDPPIKRPSLSVNWKQEEYSSVPRNPIS